MDVRAQWREHDPCRQWARHRERAAADGLGLAYVIESEAGPLLRSGELVRVLEEWSPAAEGLYLYHPSHRQMPAALRALIEMLQAARRTRH